MKKLFAFTLAEVLITLSIIGVIAAITMPVFIAKYNKMIWVTQLKKSVSTLENGFRLALAHDMVENLSQTKWFKKFEHAASPAEYDKYFEEGLRNYFNIISFEQGKREVEPFEPDYKIQLADGSILYYNREGGYPSKEECDELIQLGTNMCGYRAIIAIDVNGEKKPNFLGRDIFWFKLGTDALLYPIGGRDDAIYEDRSATEMSENRYHWSNQGKFACNPTSTETDSRNATGCAGRVIEEGWKMNY